MPGMQPHRINTISEYHRLTGLPKPANSLVSVINFEAVARAPTYNAMGWVLGFYSIALKWNFQAKMRYGQQSYDFDEGIMTFMAPGQTLRIESEPRVPIQHSGWLLLIHPDFLWNTALAKAISKYEFFGYSVNEALFLSEKEEETVSGVMQSIRQEYHANIDRFSQHIIIAQIELLLSYSERFYERQFITRNISSHQVLERLEEQLNQYFNSDDLMQKGVPTVAAVAESLNVSPDYLSGLLKSLTGLNTQQHIHQRLIDKAKEKLSTTGLSVSEIAYQLGFEHLQSFSKLFKLKTNLSPLAFRQLFN